jgi:polar amino acid transport system substrate-binding protein
LARPPRGAARQTHRIERRSKQRRARATLRQLGAAAALAFVSLAARASLAAGPLERLAAQGELRWAGDLQGGEPFVFRDPVDPSRLLGFEVELAGALARKLGVRAAFVQNDWHNLIPSLVRGDFDVALNGLEPLPGLDEQVLLTRPYLTFRETLVVRREAKRRSLEALRGARVGTLSGSLAHQLLRGAGVELVLYEGQEEPYRDLAAGRLEAVLLDELIAARYGLSQPALELADGDVARGSYVIAVRKEEPQLRDALDAALNTLSASGELQAIFARWKIEPAPPPATSEPSLPDPAAYQKARFDGEQLWLFAKGAGITLLVSLLAMALAAPLGLLLALARLYGSGPLRALAYAYVELWRGTPVLLQLYLLYYGLAPVVHLSALAAAVLGLGMNYGAYEAEVHRAALSSLPVGQSEAAAAMGLSRLQMLRLVLLPQSLRTALPAMANDLIALLKDSSLVSVITVVELTKQMTITAVDVRGWALPGAVCALLYFAMSWPLSRLAQRLEERLAAGSAR